MIKLRRPGGLCACPLMLLLAWGLPLAGARWAHAQNAPTAARPLLTLEDLYSEYNVIDADISPSGKLIAAVVRRDNFDAIVCLDVTTGEKKVVTQIGKDSIGKQLDVRMGFVYWKTENRLLIQLQSDPAEGVELRNLSHANILKLGNRLLAVDRDGKNLKVMFDDQWKEELVGAFDTSDIASMLWNDPQHILVRVGGWDGRSLFKVNVETGVGKVVENQRESIIDWWFDVNGNAVVRVEYSLGTLRYYRKLPDGKWKKYYSVRRKEMEEQPDFSWIGPSEDPGKFYVLAKPPGHDRLGIYLYDLQQEAFGAPLVEHPTYDIALAAASTDGTKLLYHCFDEDVRVCEFANPSRNAHLRGLRKYFDQSANVLIVDSSDDGNTLLLLVDGPREPPSYYYYLVEAKSIEFVGIMQGALKDKAMPTSEIVRYKTRDGQEQTGYLTYPPGAQGVKQLPLVLMPHGGPQTRDRLEFDPWVQYLAARGYAVFQPNFRGSGGFGEAYELSGHREWGRKMQNDLDDGVKALADRGTIDPARVCIVGASYGGYAALAGAAFTPDAYQCAVSLAGIADLEAFVRWKKKKYGSTSDVFEHFVRAIGDPDKDQEAIRAVSPAFHIDAIKIPILLIHGEEDDIVPVSQSESMQELLEKSGRKTQLLRLSDEEHGGFSRNSSKVMLSTIGGFLWEHLGKGYGVDAPPVKYAFTTKKKK